MTLRLAVKLMVPGLAVAALAFHGISHLAGWEPLRVLAAQRPAESRGGAAGPVRRPASPDDMTSSAAHGSSGIKTSSAHGEGDEPLSDPESPENAPPPRESLAHGSRWWWPFGADKEPEPDRSMPPPSAAVAVQSAAPSAAPATASSGSPASSALVELIAITRSGGTMSGDEFSVAQTRDLKIVVWWALNSQHVQRLELLSPDGSLYQRLQTAFDADTAKLVQRGSQTYISVETIIPVAGTWITDHSLFGPWAVNVYLDDDEATSRNASFIVNP